MRKILNLILVSFTVLTMTSCYRVSPDADEESVLVYKPYLFGHGGVDKEAISTGATWVVASTDHKEFKIVPITITESFKNMIPKDNTPISFDVYLKIQLHQGQTPELYKKFGSDWYSHSLQATFRTMVRDRASAFNMFELASKREISSKLEREITNELVAYAKKINLPATIMQVSIGAITPPQEVLNETKNTAAQNQSILTQSARANAELSRKQAEINKAIADRAYMTQMGMTTNEYLSLRALEIEKEKVELIKDHDNVSIIFGGANTGTTLPIKH